MVRNYVTAELRRSKRAYFEGVVWQPKKLWTEMNKILGRHVGTPVQLLRTEGGDLTDSRDIAEAINRFLINRIECMVADIDDGTSRPSSADSGKRNVTVPKFALTPIDESTVIDLLRKLDVSKAMGCDSIQVRALKLAAMAIARPLCSRLKVGTSGYGNLQTMNTDKWATSKSTQLSTKMVKLLLLLENALKLNFEAL